jgi:hypothetical protein
MCLLRGGKPAIKAEIACPKTTPKNTFFDIFRMPVLTYARPCDILRRELVDAVGHDAHAISLSQFGASSQSVAMRYP